MNSSKEYPKGFKVTRIPKNPKIATKTIIVEVKVAWWFRYLYVPGLVFMFYIYNTLTDTNIKIEPNWDKVNEVIDKALTAKLVRK